MSQEQGGLLFSFTRFRISWFGFKFAPCTAHLGLVGFQGLQQSWSGQTHNTLSQVISNN